MTDESPAPRTVTVNQIVAGNMAYYRKAAELSQAELGEHVGWSDKGVSAAERSFAGGRTREFDAHTLLALSLAIGVPPLALMLPPEDEGAGVTYQVEMPDGRVLGMADYFKAIMPDTDDDSPVMQAYRNRLIDASARYRDAGWDEDVIGLLRDMTAPRLRQERVERMRWQREGLLGAAQSLGEISDLIESLDDAEDGER